ncbi:MAG: c-type cytochrome [Alphaproteobacteria bacterium]
MRRWLWGLLACGAILAGIGWAWPSAETPARGANAADSRQVARGEIVYRDYCAACHGANLEGQPAWRTRKPDGRLPAPPHDATGHTWHHSDAQLFALTKQGVVPPLAPEGYESDMPGFAASLSDAEIWAVLAYIKSRWPADIQARQAALGR